MSVSWSLPLVNAQEERGSLIVPGKSVGEISLGMKTSTVGKKLGENQTGEAATGREWCAWFGPKEGGGRGSELDIRFNFTADDQKDRVATAIRLESPFFHTKEGVSTQSSLAEIWKAFPGLHYSDTDDKDAAVERYVDAGHGIAIEVHRTNTSAGSATAPEAAWGVCQAIIVFIPNEILDGAIPNIRSMRSMPDN